MGGAAGYIQEANSVLQTEAVACMKAMQAAQNWGIVRVDMEIDAQLLVNAILGDDQDLSLNGVLFREIKFFAMLNFTSFSISFCPRACNKFADACATYGAKLDQQPQVVWQGDAPAFVRDIVASGKAVLWLMKGILSGHKVTYLYRPTLKFESQNIMGPVRLHGLHSHETGPYLPR
jgi:hypothetical protein